MTSESPPDEADLQAYQRANALLNAGRPGEALALFDVIVTRRPRFAQAHAGRGLALAATGANEAAVQAVGNALKLDPQGASSVLVHLGYQFLQTGRPSAAHAAFCRLLADQPGSLTAEQGRIMALISLSRFDEALPALAALRSSGRQSAGRPSATPDIDYLPGIYFHAQLQCCDWSDYERTAAALTDGVRRKQRVDMPHTYLSHGGSPADQRLCAETFVADRCTADAPPVPRKPPRPTDLGPPAKLRIAYLSSDLRDHAVGQLMVGVFEAHDRERFETYAFSSGPDDASELQGRLRRSFDYFLDVNAWPDRTIAMRMAELDIDVAIDLGGHSSGGRTRVLSFRPAPIQMSLLGFPGTLGTNYIDYLVADSTVVPAEQRDHYAEKLIYLPDSFLPAHGAPVRTPAPTRSAAGLPESGFVYCCFNAPYKISPPLFDVWMRVLEAVPGSVLWLRDVSATVRRNLGEEAARRGVDPGRLVFAARTPSREQHYARFSLADVFLDTSPYNAHTTAAESLGSGVPIVTLKGSTFAGRVAASLLTACGAPELAVDTLSEYERLAVALAGDSDRLARLKERLLAASSQSTLFDPVRYCRNLEAALSRAWVRHQRGEAAATFDVGGSPSTGTSGK